MIWFKSLFFLIFNWFTSTVVWLDEDKDSIETSWLDYLKNKEKPQIILYSFDGCPSCVELSAWMEVEWIPFRKVECAPIYPRTAIKLRQYQQYILHKCKEKKTRKKAKLLMHPEFPQMELIANGKVEKQIFFNINTMKEEIKQFLQLHKVPGFISGENVHDQKAPPPFGSEGTEEKIVEERKKQEEMYEKMDGQVDYTPEDILSELQTAKADANK